MTWWQRFFYGFNTTKNEEEEEKDSRKGEIASPDYVISLKKKGYHWNNPHGWWQRIWTTWRPEGLEHVWETEVFDEKTEEWTYRIVNPECLGGPGGGGHSGGWCIWEDKVGKKK